VVDSSVESTALTGSALTGSAMPEAGGAVGAEQHPALRTTATAMPMQSTALREIATRFDIVYPLSYGAPFRTIRRRFLEFADHADAWAHGLSLATLLQRVLFARVKRDRMKQKG
jgi:hypothetical protein